MLLSEEKILVAEDDVNLQNLYNEILTKAGYTVLITTNGQECLNVAFKEKPDLILLDLMMPVKSGEEVLIELAKDAWGEGVPVIVLTNKGDVSTMMSSYSKGVAAYMVKANVKMEDMLSKIKETLAVRSLKM